jgi:hypothetical protein
MKMPDTWKSLWNNDDFIANLTALIKTINGIASLVLIALAVYLPYQAIQAIVSWF